MGNCCSDEGRNDGLGSTDDKPEDKPGDTELERKRQQEESALDQASAVVTGADGLRVPPNCTQYNPSATETAVWMEINAYRRANGQPEISMSPALCYVAHLHCEDMSENLKACTHGWSDKDARWKGQESHSDGGDSAIGMWGKPKELTAGWGSCAFTGKGYEIAASWPKDPKKVVTMWKEEGLRTRPHNDVMLNLEDWKRFQWKSLGVGVYKGYCAAWFSDQVDPSS